MKTGILFLQITIYLMKFAVANYDEISELLLFPDRGRIKNDMKKDFILGGLFPISSSSGNLRMIEFEMVEAMRFAIDRINNDMNLLPNLTIGYDVRDTYNDKINGLYEAFDLVWDLQSRNHTYNILGIVGPAYTTVSYPVATLIGLFEIPVISYASSDAALSNKDFYKNFFRTIPSDNLQVNAMVDLVSYFGWEYVSMIFNDNDFGVSASNAFIDVAGQHSICLGAKISIPPSGAKFNQTVIRSAVRALLNSTASVVVVFADEGTVLALFEELSKTNSTRKFVWIASDKWADSHLVCEKFPEIANGTFGFQLHTKHLKEFDNYVSAIIKLFQEYFCNENGNDCPDGVHTSNPSYSHGNTIPYIIDAVYVFAHAIQNFLDDNCDSPIRWNHTARQCDGMEFPLTGENLLGYLYNVTFTGIQNYTVSFDENGDPSGVYEISNLQLNKSGQYEYVSIGFWNSSYKEKALIISNDDGIGKIISICSKPCNEGRIISVTNPNCPSCFECIPCVGPTYSTNSSNTECDTCPNNHWGNNPLSGSTHCVPVKVRHLDFSSEWSIVSMCIATIALIILTAIIVIFIINWNTPVVKSSDREQMIMLMVGIGICCALTFIVIAPPSTNVCVFQRIGVWLCFSLAFGALLLKIVRIAKIFYSIESSAKRPSFIDSKYQITFTMSIVFVQLIVVVIGMIIDPPIVKRDPDVVSTSSGQQTGNAPEIVETCQQAHTAILVLSLVYNSVIIAGCIILGWMTRRFPDNFNEAERIMFTSFTLMIVWVLFVPLYLNTKREFQMGVLALGIVLSAFALMAGIFFPRVYIIIFQRHKNTREYVSKQNYQYTAKTVQSTNPPMQNMPTEKTIKPVVKEDGMLCA